MSVQHCPRCSALLPPGLERCPRCGTSLPTESTSTDEVSAWEFRELVKTILFPILGLVLISIVVILILVLLLT